MNTQIKPYQALLELYTVPEINAQVRPFDEMVGFISALSASPVQLELADWFPLLWGLEGASFSNEVLARDFAAAVLKYYDHCLANYQQSAPLSLPTELWLNEENDVTAAGSAFAAGYLAAFQQIEPSWQELNLAAESESGQLLQTTLLLLSKMATADNQDAQMQELFTQLPGMDKIIAVLPSLLAALGHFSVVVSNNG